MTTKRSLQLLGVCLQFNSILVDPVLERQKDGVDPFAVSLKRASAVQQLLNDLVVGSEVNVRRNPKAVTPKFERLFERLGRERGGDTEIEEVGRFLSRAIGAIQIGKSHTPEFQIIFS